MSFALATQLIVRPAIVESNKKRTGTLYAGTLDKLELFKVEILIPLIQQCFSTRGNGSINFSLLELRNHKRYGSRHPKKLFDNYFTIVQRAGRSPNGVFWPSKISMNLTQILRAGDLLREYGIKPVVSDLTGYVISWDITP